VLEANTQYFSSVCLILRIVRFGAGVLESKKQMTVGSFGSRTYDHGKDGGPSRNRHEDKVYLFVIEISIVAESLLIRNRRLPNIVLVAELFL